MKRGARRLLGRQIDSLFRFLLRHRRFDVGGFHEYEECGVHILPLHYYSPIPVSRELNKRKAEWNREKAFVGVDFRLADQLRFLPQLHEYAAECLKAFSYADVMSRG